MEQSQIREWMEKFDWERNPFNFRIYPELMIGYEDEARRIRNSLESDSKFTLLLGETGAGKTNMLRSIERDYSGAFPLFYMSKPPVNESDLLEYMRDEVLEPGTLARLLNSYSLYNIDEALNDKYADNLVLLVDEGHEASIEVLEWLRTAIDHIDGLSVVAAGLPSFEDKLEEEVGTLYSRATEIVRLQSLDKDSTIQLVRKRIEQVGGASIEPFTQSALLQVYEATDGFPREVLRVCNECVITAADEDKSIIDEEDVQAVLDESSDEMNTDGSSADTGETSEDAADAADEGGEDEDGGTDEGAEQDTVNLTPKQEAIYQAIEETGEATSGEIVDHLGSEDYKTRSHAIRSINNILRRLVDQGVVERERRGRNYLYRLPE
ncbi:MAG: BlaI/MecI/CopY family transcriptional regulator [Candidatus Nanohaloarchaea archaeon]|nr:BlaI/MecI/CopY family transcriptional regulator [Candidatus Nanohaloarchaea archaeon]